MKKNNILNLWSNALDWGCFSNPIELNDILNGYIMSDGYVDLKGILIVHQSKKQEKFVEWLYEKLKPIRTDSPIKDVIMLDKHKNVQYSSKRFSTRSVLKEYRELWYKPILVSEGQLKYIKVLPDNISDMFTSTFVTLWYAVKGTKNIGSKGAKIEVTCYSPEERLLLKTLFKEKFDIKTLINRAGKSKSGKEQWTITIQSKEYDKFHALITQMDLIPKIFPHKLHKNPK